MQETLSLIEMKMQKALFGPKTKPPPLENFHIFLRYPWPCFIGVQSHMVALDAYIIIGALS